MKVFISSTRKDLQEYRQKAIEVVNRLEDIPQAMEFFGAQPDAPTTVCSEKIKRCDIFIGIYAHRYGFVPHGQEKSITQLEYELAKELGKDRLCFIVEKGFPWNPDWIEMDKYDALNTFLDVVKKECVVEFFKSPEDFTGKLSTSLAKLAAKLRDTGGGKGKLCLVPYAPYPYIAHPYPLPDHFTGRLEEMATLSHWFYNETEPMLVLEAIGGMGKTALTWVWLHREILAKEKNPDLPGVFWWSFYEAPFETFIQHLACYVLGKEAEKSGPSGQPGMWSTGQEDLLAALYNHKFLLVLDGLERALRGYAGMEAMFIQEKKFQEEPESDAEWDRRQREPVLPAAARFLKHLAAPAAKSRILITTRLLPAPLEGLAGVKHIFLKGLSPQDAVRFLQDQGVKGSRAELEQAGRVYGFHPLLLKLLASAITNSRQKDIAAAYRCNLIDAHEPHKILEKSYGLLSKTEQQVATYLAVFRGPFTFAPAQALLPRMEEERLWATMQELCRLGFLFYSQKEDRFDFHPILRSFLYQQLTNPNEVHNAAVQYFQALPKPEKVISLEDLAPVIELYHHLVKSENYDEAHELFYDRIHNSLYYQLSAYPLSIELMRELLREGEERLSRFITEADQAGVLHDLANTYALVGQPAQAVPLFLRSIYTDEEKNDKKLVAISLGNVVNMAQISLGRLSAAAVHVQKSITLCREIGSESWESVGYLGLGRILVYQERVTGNAIDPSDEALFKLAFKLFLKNKLIHYLSIVSAYRSLSVLMKVRLTSVQTKRKSAESEDDRASTLFHDALAQAHQALTYAEKTIKDLYPIPRNFVQAYWLLGEALIQVHLHCVKGVQGGVTPGTERERGLEIPFYDEYFRQIVETLAVQPGKELHAADCCLQDALRRCRTINLVELEPDLLLALVRLEWARVHGQPIPKKIERLTSLGEPLKEAHDLAQRCGYRLKLADLHLFCGQALLDCHTTGRTGPHPLALLGLTALQHLHKAKEYALDVSEFSDLYQSPDPEFYKGIPEYEMLKRGLTNEERIRNGYFPVYQMAEILEANLYKEAHEL